ncbi:hypothetical protein D3C77_221020 [compost metagenome]
MTLFGQTLDGQQIFGLATLVAVLALWLVVLARHKDQRRRRGDGPGPRPDRRSKTHRNGHPPAARGPWG